MNKSNKIFALAATVLAASAMASAADARTKTKAQVAPVVGTAPTLNSNPLKSGFDCVGQLTAQSPTPIRVAVGKVNDYTGKFSNEASEGGFRVTQGGSLMVISALGKLPNVDVIERLDTQVADIDLLLSKVSLVRDGNVVRGMTAGMYDGADYYIVGGITEVNYNLRSSVGEVGVSNIGAGHRVYTMNVAADLRIVDARSLKVIKTISVQKQIKGYENKAGVFSFFGDYLVDLNFGSKGQEPLQMGVRSVLEAGTLELVAAVTPNKDFYANSCRAHTEAVFGQ